MLDSIGDSSDLNQLNTWLIPLPIASKTGPNRSKVSRNGVSLSIIPLNTQAKNALMGSQYFQIRTAAPASAATIRPTGLNNAPIAPPSKETEPVTIPHSAGRTLTAFIDPVRREKPRRSFASGPASTPIASDNEPTVAVIASSAPPAISSWRVSAGWACASAVTFDTTRVSHCVTERSGPSIRSAMRMRNPSHALLSDFRSPSRLLAITFAVRSASPRAPSSSFLSLGKEPSPAASTRAINDVKASSPAMSLKNDTRSTSPYLRVAL
ncbi:hypothetical protein EC12E129_00633 [Escherichia coli O145:H28]|nr:hypothetical protein EC12E129_00633 [Escherichia coli O145:H28]